MLKQTFLNASASEDIKECTYTFPLYDGVSVVSFMCKIGQRTLRGIVKEKTEAKHIFDTTVAKGETAGLLVQAQEAADVFSTKLGSISAGKKIIVEITYISELKHDDVDGIRFTIPTRVAPRYGSGPATTSHHTALDLEESSAAGFGAALSTPPGQISITIDINLPDGLLIKGVQSPSHPIAVSMGTVSTAVQADPVMSKASATLSLGSSVLERDFILIIHSKGTAIPKAFLETHSTIPGHRALMATLVPRFSLPPSPSEIVFVADRSGSMKSNIPMLISAMKVFLKSMPTGIKFNICSFGTKQNFLWPKSKRYTGDTLGESMEHVSTFAANFGGTETFKAIEATIKSRLGDIPLEIILLTDGDIWSQAQLFAYVNKQVEESQGNIRVFPLGIGTGVSHSLIEGLARAGNGFAQAVQHGERLDNSVVRMLRGALTPHITNYTLEVKYKQDEDDLEVIERVTDSMKRLLADRTSSTKMRLETSEPVESGMTMRLSDEGLLRSKHQEPKPEGKPQATISLFDSKVNQDTGIIKTLDKIANLPYLQYPRLLQAPHRIPSLVPFSRTTVYLLMGPETIQRNPTSVILRATSSHGPLALEIPIEAVSERGTTIHQLAARKASQDLEESRGWVFDGEVADRVLIKDQYPSEFEALVQKEAVRIGETFQVANKWCSFVAVAANGNVIMERNPCDTEREGSIPGFEYPQDSYLKPIRTYISAAIPQDDDGSISDRISAKSTRSRSRSPRRAQRGGPPGAFSMGNFGTNPQSGIRSGQSRGEMFNAKFTSEPRTTGSQAAMSMNSSLFSARPQPQQQPPPKASIKTDADKVLAIIDLQAFDGSWDPQEKKLPALLGFEVPKAPQGMDGNAWVTILVIAFLEMNMAREEGMWGLVVEKGRGYVQSVLQDGIEELEKIAVEVVGKN